MKISIIKQNSNYENIPKIESIKCDLCPRKLQCELGDFNLGRECLKSLIKCIVGKKICAVVPKLLNLNAISWFFFSCKEGNIVLKLKIYNRVV